MEGKLDFPLLFQKKACLGLAALWEKGGKRIRSPEMPKAGDQMGAGWENIEVQMLVKTST